MGYGTLDGQIHEGQLFLTEEWSCHLGDEPTKGGLLGHGLNEFIITWLLREHSIFISYFINSSCQAIRWSPFMLFNSSFVEEYSYRIMYWYMLQDTNVAVMFSSNRNSLVQLALSTFFLFLPWGSDENLIDWRAKSISFHLALNTNYGYMSITTSSH